jgi:general stress protein 26
MEKELALRLGIELVESAQAAYFTTINTDGFPETRAMLNLRNKELYPGLTRLFDKIKPGLDMYFTTNTSSGKVKQALSNEKASVYYCAPEAWRGLLLTGRVEVVKDNGIKQAFWQKGWELYYKKGSLDPDFALLRFIPAGLRYYHQLEKAVFELGGENEKSK